MSEMAKEARSKAREKAERLVRGHDGPVDASGWKEPLGELGTIQTGPRPVSRQNFKSGGKVAGLAGAMRSDRKPRKAGGRTFADALINRDVKEANESREGQKHIGGMARGGHADAAQDKKLIHSEMHKAGCNCAKCSGGRVERKSGGGNWIAGAVKHPGSLHKEMGIPQGEKIPAKKLNAAAAKGGKEGERARLAKTLKGFHHKAGGGSLDGKLQGLRPQGGRLARKGGGAAKKGMTVNVIVAPGGQQRPPMPPPGALPPPGAGPLGMHQGAPPPMPPPGAGAPMGPGAPPPMMPRARGGRTTSHALAKPGSYPLDHASGGGLGRLEKIKAYGKNA